ncbi:hypothetical protein T261_5906 [Streptomyces lydicus]|nr:hypothetical protein T261_5906 [Streptomyces lydicus]
MRGTHSERGAGNGGATGGDDGEDDGNYTGDDTERRHRATAPSDDSEDDTGRRQCKPDSSDTSNSLVSSIRNGSVS